MAIPIADILGDDALMHPERQLEVIRLISRLIMSTSDRRLLYSRWARLVGIPVLAGDLDRVAPLERPPRPLP